MKDMILDFDVTYCVEETTYFDNYHAPLMRNSTQRTVTVFFYNEEKAPNGEMYIVLDFDSCELQELSSSEFYYNTEKFEVEDFEDATVNKHSDEYYVERAKKALLDKAFTKDYEVETDDQTKELGFYRKSIKVISEHVNFSESE